MPDAADVIARAHGTRVVVVGAGLGGLVAARECAKLGLQVTVIEAADRLGGSVAPALLGDLTTDAGADRFAPGTAVAALVDELGLTERVVTALPGTRWISGIPSGAAPAPADTFRGIPANPWADDVRAIIGWGGAWRAYLDRLRPPLTIGHQQSLGALVRRRMGERVLQRLVAPAAAGVFGLSPDDVDVAVAAPGLGAALTRTGSLAGAVAQLLPDAPPPADRSLDGGMTGLVTALAGSLAELGATVRTGLRAERLTAAGGRWRVEVAPSQLEAADAADDDTDPIDADLVVVATAEAAARALCGPIAALPTAAESRRVEAITLLVDSPELDAPPRGPEVVPVPGTAVASAALHLTATWAWLAEAAGPGRHVVRVVLPAEHTDTLTDAEAVSLAGAEASALLGVPLPVDRVRAAHRLPASVAAPASVIGHAEHAAGIRSALDAHAARAFGPDSRSGLAAVGAWVAGTGMAAVVADALAEADRARSRVLWGQDPDRSA